MRPALRRLLLATILGPGLLAPSVASADILSHMLDAGGGGGEQQPNPDDAALTQWAGTPEETSLPQLLQTAMKIAPNIQNAKIDIAVAEAQIEETFARQDWFFKAEVQGSRSPGSIIGGFAFDSATNFTATADLTHVMATGGTIGFHASTQYSDTELGGGLPAQKEWDDSISVSLVQPLMKGRGRFLYEANEKKARLSKDAAVLANRVAAIKVVEAIVSDYWDLVLAERQIAITQQSLDLARERMRVTQIGAEGGKTARSEIPAVEQIIATRQEDVLGGELAILNASISIRRATGMAIHSNTIALRVPADIDIAEKTWDLPSLLDKAYAQSPELAQLAKQGEGATIDIEVTKNGLLPQLDLALQIGPIGQDTTFLKAGKDLVDVKAPFIGGSLTYSRSIEQRDVKGRVKELETSRQKITVNAQDIKAQYAESMARAVAGLEVAKRRVVLSQRAIDLAKENIRIETDRFSLGRSTNFDVLNRQEELRQAELRRTQAMIDWHKAEVVVNALTGDILPMYGISVD